MCFFASSDHWIPLVFHQSPSTVSSSDGSLYILLSLFFLCLSHKYLKLKVNQAHGEKREQRQPQTFYFVVQYLYQNICILIELSGLISVSIN